MERREEMDSGEAPPSPPSPPSPRAAESTGVERVENSNQGGGVAVATGAVSVATAPVKRKRGRPRKYAPDGTALAPLNPSPLSASVPVGQFSLGVVKRGRGRPLDFTRKQQHHGIEIESMGEMVACSAGANFTPHVITVAAGEDVTMKIISFSQQGSRAICVLSANGVISNVTLRLPDSSGGTLTYEGRFELLSLSGSFTPTDNGGTKSRSGGISVSLASPDGRVVGGSVAGLLVAASPVQVVVGSFLPSYQMEQKTKKPKFEITTSISMSAAAIPTINTDRNESYGGAQVQQLTSMTTKPNPAASTSFRGENWTTLHSASDARDSTTDINVSLPSG